MPDPNSLVRHSFVTAALAAAPAAAALAALVALGALPWHWAAAGALAVFAGCYVVARRESSVAPKVVGTVTALYIEEGNYVETGQILA